MTFLRNNRSGCRELGILDGSEIPEAMRELKQIQKELEEQIRNAGQKKGDDA